MVVIKTISQVIKTISSSEEPKSPNRPEKNDPFKKHEDDNDATRIRPNINEPGKTDPTRIDTPPNPAPLIPLSKTA